MAFRRPEWLALEDKTVVDALLDRAGVARAPSDVRGGGRRRGGAPPVDVGAGTVWAADAREGFHGGATLTRWVVDDADAAAATRELAPLLRHRAGDAVPRRRAVLDPRDRPARRGGGAAARSRWSRCAEGRELVYAGCATYWDPPDAVREEMRAAARLVGEQLRAEVGFRGAFTLDGVVTVDGFRPTEVNPRFGAGFNVMARSLASVPLVLVLDLVVAGHDLDISAAELEAGILADADTARGGGTWRIMERGHRSPRRGAMSYDDGGVAMGDRG